MHPARTGASHLAPSPSAISRYARLVITRQATAQHWYDRGHVLYVLEGELDTELRDMRNSSYCRGMSYYISDDNDALHRSSMQTGIKQFIVD
jgi:hypothetical protein